MLEVYVSCTQYACVYVCECIYGHVRVLDDIITSLRYFILFFQSAQCASARVYLLHGFPNDMALNNIENRYVLIFSKSAVLTVTGAPGQSYSAVWL